MRLRSTQFCFAREALEAEIPFSLRQPWEILLHRGMWLQRHHARRAAPLVLPLASCHA